MRCGRSRPRSGRPSCRRGCVTPWIPRGRRSRCAAASGSSSPTRSTSSTSGSRTSGPGGRGPFASRGGGHLAREAATVVLVAERPAARGPRRRPERGRSLLPGLGAARDRAVDGDPGLPALPILTDPAAAGHCWSRRCATAADPGCASRTCARNWSATSPGSRATLVLRPALRRGRGPGLAAQDRRQDLPRRRRRLDVRVDAALWAERSGTRGIARVSPSRWATSPATARSCSALFPATGRSPT